MRLHRPRLKVRSLLLITAVIGCNLAFYIDRARCRQQAVTSISALGGTVKYDYQKASIERADVFNAYASEWGPAWLRQAVGKEFFHDVVLINLAGKPVTDMDLAALRKLPALEYLDLSNTRVTSAGLIHISKLKNLKWLSLSNTQVDDDGLRNLAELTMLQSLHLDETMVTDSGVKHLEGLKELDDRLGLVGTGVTDSGLVHLKELTKLRQVDVRKTNVTAAGAKDLERTVPNAYIHYERQYRSRW
jgi:hypothetical protein